MHEGQKMWNSVAALQWWQLVLGWTGVGLIGLSLLLGAGNIVVRGRLDELRSEAAADRRLSEAQSRVLSDGLRGLTVPIELFRLDGTPEVARYAEDFATAIKAAGVELKGTTALGPPVLAAGLHLRGPNTTDFQRMATAINAAGLRAEFGGALDHLQIAVGQKP